MRLLQIKLRGLGNLPVTNWVTLSRTLTLLRFTDTQVGRQVLEAVQALNPPYDCLSERPFDNLPMEEAVAGGYRRAIIPEKRTIVIGIFDTPSALVKELGVAPLARFVDYRVAGVPPDYFSETGQLWGNPLYDWERHGGDGYAWWIARTLHALDLADALRLDHFRGFASYWEVAADEETAENGRWVAGPGRDLFDALHQVIGRSEE